MPVESKFLTQKNTASLSPGIFVAGLLMATAIGVGTMVFLFDPATHRFYPLCLFHALTGLNCPGCGMTRALYALLHGNIRLALKDNALFVLALTAAAIWFTWFIFRKLNHQPTTLNFSTKKMWALLAVALIFAVVRNLPGFEWLSP